MPPFDSNPASVIGIVLQGRRMEVAAGSSIGDVAARAGEPSKGWKAPVAALLDGRLVPLHHILYDGAEIRLVRSSEPMGWTVYRRSLSVIIQAAVRNVFPGVKLVVGQSLGGGVFYDWVGDPPVNAKNARILEREMRRIVDENLPIEFCRVGERQASRMFRQLGMDDRLMLMSTWWHESVKLVCLGDYFDIRHGPIAISTGRLPFFSVVSLRGGVLLRFPEAGRGAQPRGRPNVVRTLFDVFRETKEWNRILGVSTVGDLNNSGVTGEIQDIIRVAEGLHEQKIVGIAESIRRRSEVRVVCIAGPSSSGKTTFAKRLGIQLRVQGLSLAAVSVDDYYVDREKTPLDERGEYDFEALDAVDLPLFNDHLGELLAGREVRIPRYDFTLGKRVEESKWTPRRVGREDLILIEGIHALNPRLTAGVDSDIKFGIYVSALTQLCLDDANRISTTDVRLLRRIVRDRHYRGYSATATLKKWPSVKRGEARNIFPFQGLADVMFNSTLVFEVAVLKMYAQRFLLKVSHDAPEFAEAYRLLKFLDLFLGVTPDFVPRKSIMREFIGGSDFDY